MRRPAAALAFILAALVAGACGSNTETSGSERPKETPAQEQEAVRIQHERDEREANANGRKALDEAERKGE
jgi:ABC-type enterochelin transport system substrate-binding protein